MLTPASRLCRFAPPLVLVALGAAQTKTALGPPGGQPQYQFVPLLEVGFERPDVTSSTSTSLQGSWGGWTMQGPSGVTLGNGGIAAPTQSAPQGGRVGYLGTGGTIACTIVTSDIVRVRVDAAQRLQASGPDSQSIGLYIDGELAQVIAPSGENFETFVSRPVDTTTSGAVLFEFVALNSAAGLQTALIDRVRFEGINAWDDDNSWTPTGVPESFNDVEIPPNASIAIRSTGAVAGEVSVQGDLLVANRVSSLSAANVLVGGEGALFQVGQEGAPFLESFTLTLTEPVASDPLDNGPMGRGHRYLIVNRGGTIDLHGDTTVPWARLDGILSGPDELSLDRDTDWDTDDQIIVTGATQESSPPKANGDCPTTVGAPIQAEVRQMNSVSPDGRTVGIASSLVNRHIDAPPMTYNNSDHFFEPPVYQQRSWVLDQRSYVGSLTRNIVIQGASDSDAEGLGGHVMVADGGMFFPNASSPATMRAEGVEFRRMGQSQKVGRYPIHWHMMLGDAMGNYVRNCSIHSCFNRAITIHGTDYVLVEGNVVADAVGHAMFLEDGSEQFNSFYGNLVIGTRRPDPNEDVIASDNQHCDVQDRSPGSFWITNPVNSFQNNVVTDSVGSAYWIAVPATGVLGLSSMEPFSDYFVGRVPRDSNLLLFSDNVAVACGMGIDMGDIIDPDTEETSRALWRPTAPRTNFSGFIAYGCYTGIYTAGFVGTTAIFHDAQLADNIEALRVATGTLVSGSLIVSDTDHMNLSSRQQVAFVMYDGSSIVDQCHFVGFDVGAPNDPALIRRGGGRSVSTGRTISNATYWPAGQPHITFEDDDSMWPSSFSSSNPDICLNRFLCDPQYAGNPRKWGHTMRLGDAEAWIGVPTPVTVTGLHPLIVTESKRVYSSALDPNVSGQFIELTTDRYAYLRVTANIDNVTGNGVPENPFMSVQRRARTRPSALNPSVMVTDPTTAKYEDKFDTDPHRMFPAIVSEGFWYYLYFPNAQQNLDSQGIEIIAQDMEAGDTLILRLDAFTDYDTVTWEGPVSNPVSGLTSGSAVRNSPVAAHGVSNGGTSISRVWIKLVHNGGDGAIKVKLENLP